MFKPGDKVRVIKSRFSKSYYGGCDHFSKDLDESKTYTVNQIYHHTTNGEQYFTLVGEINNHPHDIFELVSGTDGPRRSAVLISPGIIMSAPAKLQKPRILNL